MKYTNTFFIFVLAFFVLSCGNIRAQEYQDKPYHNMEELQDLNEGLFNQIYNIVKKYPDFTYEYEYKSGKLAGVNVTGVPDESDRKKLESMIFDWKVNSEKILNLPNRTGVYYAAENNAKPAIGYEKFHQKLISNLAYPDDARSAGVGGMIYLKFVVDDDGSVRYLTASEDIESPYQNLVDELKQEAKKAFRKTDVKWDPATVDGIPVSSYVVVPVDFNFEKNPTLPALIR